jgi:aldose 1-epimerase
MEIYSGQILEIGNDMIPTGRIIDISDTPFDFRKRKQIGKDIDADNPQMKIAGGYDHNYIFQNDRKLQNCTGQIVELEWMFILIYVDCSFIQEIF